MNKYLSDFKVHDGREQVAERVSLSKSPSFKSDALDRFSPEDFLRLRRLIECVLPGAQGIFPQLRIAPELADEDSIDAAFTVEVLGKLPKVIDRATCLDQMSLDQLPNVDVKFYFEEAHRCYLYGFNVACAVLCRAILASALDEICKKFGLTSIAVPRSDSEFEVLVDQAIAGGHLQVVQKKSAIDVRNAGNDAIHRLSKFKRQWENKLDEVLEKTRKTLLDLYTH